MLHLRLLIYISSYLFIEIPNNYLSGTETKTTEIEHHSSFDHSDIAHVKTLGKIVLGFLFAGHMYAEG